MQIKQSEDLKCLMAIEAAQEGLQETEEEDSEAEDSETEGLEGISPRKNTR